MSPRSSSQVQQSGQDRRGKLRFPIGRELCYKAHVDNTILEVGGGYTTNIGSGGVLFSLDRELAPGAPVQLSISWPVLLEDDCPVRLVIFGRVLRCTGGHCACSIDRHESRIQARGRDGSGTRRDIKLERWADSIRRDELEARSAVVLINDRRPAWKQQAWRR